MKESGTINVKLPALSKLITHKKTVHEGQRNHMCEGCGKKFGSKSEVRRHYKLIHELVKERHPCSSCEKTFTSKAAVTSHMKIVHKGIKNFNCDHKYVQLL